MKLCNSVLLFGLKLEQYHLCQPCITWLVVFFLVLIKVKEIMLCMFMVMLCEYKIQASYFVDIFSKYQS